MSDKIGFIYWFFVLVTISFGGITGIYMNQKYKNEMRIICNQELELYKSYFIGNDKNVSSSVSSIFHAYKNGRMINGVDKNNQNNKYMYKYNDTARMNADNTNVYENYNNRDDMEINELDVKVKRLTEFLK